LISSDITHIGASRKTFLRSELYCIQNMTMLTAIAVAMAGCAAANNAPTAQGEQPYKTAYGTSSEGTTTDLYTEVFGSRQSQTASPTDVPTVQSMQTVTAQPLPPIQPVAPAQPAAGRGAIAATPGSPAPGRVPQPGYAPPNQVQPAAQVAQQSAPPSEPDTPSAYGIGSNGPTTDLYTELFGKRSSQ
jgi:hypothetical protein